jgi:hypothetical protein
MVDGVLEALVTTKIGLLVGLPALGAYDHLCGKVESSAPLVGGYHDRTIEPDSENFLDEKYHEPADSPAVGFRSALQLLTVPNRSC